jgi:predicted NBD/HSP70 family sugar kinase
MQKTILKYIKENKFSSKLDIVQRLNLSLSSVTKKINELLFDKIIVENGFGTSTGGRKPTLYSLNPDFGITVSVIVDLDIVNISINDFLSNIIAKQNIPVNLSREADSVIKKIITSIEGLMQENNLPPSKIKSIGIAGGGILNKEKGTIQFKMINKVINFFPALRKIYNDVPLMLEDVAYADAMGEKNFGQAMGISNFIYIRYKKTIGAVICSGGKIHGDSTGYVSELGHITMNKEGPLCYCGSRGCLEQFASEWYLEKEIKKALGRGTITHMKNLRNYRKKSVLEVVSEAGEKGDRLALSLLDQVSENLGIGLATLINLFHPTLLIIGGNLPEKQDSFFGLLRQYTKMYSLRELEKNVEYKLSFNIDEMGLRGLSKLVTDEVLQGFYNRSSKKIRGVK